MKSKILCSAAVLALLTGCGLMEAGKTQIVSFTSNVEDTAIYDRDGKQVCVTPCTIELPRQKNDLYLVAKKSGYVNRPFFLTVVPEKSFFKHMLTSGIIFPLSPATTVDLATGAAYEYAPGKIYLNMIEKGSTEDLEQQRQEQEIRLFFMANYEIFRLESSVGHGETLHALGQMMNVPENELAHMISKMAGSETGGNELIRLYRRAVTTGRR